ncbi:hypothetical protein [Streptomyces sp. NPDC048295]|uniref:hypothetical protein n=1 Tax=Streptomyces sp. NPDC048295 TaxID=3154617 RepID=UPI0034159CAA
MAAVAPFADVSGASGRFSWHSGPAPVSFAGCHAERIITPPFGEEPLSWSARPRSAIARAVSTWSPERQLVDRLGQDLWPPLGVPGQRPHSQGQPAYVRALRVGHRELTQGELLRPVVLTRAQQRPRRIRTPGQERRPVPPALHQPADLQKVGQRRVRLMDRQVLQPAGAQIRQPPARHAWTVCVRRSSVGTSTRMRPLGTRRFADDAAMMAAMCRLRVSESASVVVARQDCVPAGRRPVAAACH